MKNNAIGFQSSLLMISFLALHIFLNQEHFNEGLVAPFFYGSVNNSCLFFILLGFILFFMRVFGWKTSATSITMFPGIFDTSTTGGAVNSRFAIVDNTILTVLAMIYLSWHTSSTFLTESVPLFFRKEKFFEWNVGENSDRRGSLREFWMIEIANTVFRQGKVWEELIDQFGEEVW